MKIEPILDNSTSSSASSPPTLAADLSSQTETISSGVTSAMNGFHRDPSVKPVRYFETSPEVD